MCLQPSAFSTTLLVSRSLLFPLAYVLPRRRIIGILNKFVPLDGVFLKMSLRNTSVPWGRCFLFIFIVSVFTANRVSGFASMTKERTLAIIKPDGVSGNYSDRIKKEILASGFSIVKEMRAQLDEDTAKEFYAEHNSKNFFPSLVKYITSGPVLIMVLEKENAVADWRKLIGPTDAQKAKVTHPTSIRAMCGVNTEKNCVHGSDSSQSASREIVFFFGSLGDDFVEKHDEL